MSKDGLLRLLSFLKDLKSRGIRYRIEQQSPDAIMVTFTSAKSCVEVDFTETDVHYSVFSAESAGLMDQDTLKQMLKTHWGN